MSLKYMAILKFLILRKQKMLMSMQKKANKRKPKNNLKWYKFKKKCNVHRYSLQSFVYQEDSVEIFKKRDTIHV